jgi:RNA polymerase sigma factor (TIGR02999 family)
MHDLTHILSKIESGDPSASDKILPLVYDELRKLAAARMANERSDHTLQATALVHEAYVRLVDTEKAQHWNSRGHFFKAAAEAMRRILVERARAKSRGKRDANRLHLDVHDVDPVDNSDPELVMAINDALDQLASEDERLAELVKLRCFAGFSLSEAAQALCIGQSTAYEWWSYAKSRLRVLLNENTQI